MSWTMHSRSARYDPVKTRAPFRKGFAAFACHAATLLFWAVAQDGTAQPAAAKAAGGYAEAAIEDISFSGGDEYRIVIVLSNRSSHDITVEEFGREFFVQTGNGWRRLDEGASAASPGFAGTHLAAGKTERITTVVNIPAAAEGIFTTFEGDLSLRFAYRLKSAGNRDAWKNERLYWLRPGTGRWIEREGM
jgi:hypothetical protein